MSNKNYLLIIIYTIIHYNNTLELLDIYLKKRNHCAISILNMQQNACRYEWLTHKVGHQELADDFDKWWYKRTESGLFLTFCSCFVCWSRALALCVFLWSNKKKRTLITKLQETKILMLPCLHDGRICHITCECCCFIVSSLSFLNTVWDIWGFFTVYGLFCVFQWLFLKTKTFFW